MVGVVTLAPLLHGAVDAGEATYMKILANCRVLCQGTVPCVSIFCLIVKGACLLEVGFLVSPVVCVSFFYYC